MRWLVIGEESAGGSKLEEIAWELMNKIENMKVERDSKDKGQGTNGMDTRIRELEQRRGV